MPLRIARNSELGRLGSKYLSFSFTTSLSLPKVVYIKWTPYWQLRAIKLTALRVQISVLLRGSRGVLYISRQGLGFFRAQTRRRHPTTSWIGLQQASQRAKPALVQYRKSRQGLYTRYLTTYIFSGEYVLLNLGPIGIKSLGVLFLISSVNLYSLSLTSST